MSPKPVISPLSKTVIEGETVILVCFTAEDIINRKFGYNWLKNGEVLNPSHEKELVEDIFPTGSRIVFRASRNAVYTCIISSAVGTASKSSVITVIPNRNTTGLSISICLFETKFM
ncbi:uncharacterized protein B4U80_08924 [Leptotrombidium deliense]|uniref:Ig-like domain-containing protein n=1 Tax=Leptotrombidium deliense TaxID=299467 RepID=A0A443SC61_9ACAR|nr:uncharacterized protein B4U80_08924 [Leptotrombidium deliense]